MQSATPDPVGTWQVIHLHALSPPKPAIGTPCNGCGVCCASEPCPVGMVLSRRRHGSCVALRWEQDDMRYRCAAVSAPASVMPPGTRWLAPVFARLARRWIAAGSGCDAMLTAANATSGGTTD